MAQEQGFAVTGLRTAKTELAMVPELGGRIISLRSLRTGRDWCWHREQPGWLWRSRLGDDFGGSPQAGIDECVPTVAPCEWHGRAVPDHGEVWPLAWTLDPADLALGWLTSTVKLPVSPFVFRRTIRATEDGFRFDYALTNAGTAPEEYVWCVHPLFALRAGDRLELPPEVRSLRLNGGLGDRPIHFGAVWPYPEPFPGIRLDRLETPGMPQGCVKGFAGPLQHGRAALVNDASGDRLELQWDTVAAPWLGLWINRGHGGFHHVALEPTNGAPDSLAEAVGNWGQYSTLAPGATKHWALDWLLS